MAEDSPENLLYLHGDLDLKIIAARKLPNMDLISARLRRCFTVCKGCFSKPQSSHHAPSPASGASDLAGDFDTDRKAKRRGKIITSDPYVAVVVPQATIARTRVIRNSQNPKWDEHFLIPIAHPLAELEFQVKDNDALGAQLIGTVRFPAAQIATGERISGWFTIRNVFGNPPKRDTALRLEMRFTPCDGNPLYSRGIADDPNHAGVRNTYFPVRRGGSVTLYQDAHVPDDLLPQIQLDGEKVFSHEKCWEDLCYSISEAHHLIYVVGWSISHKIKLVREPTRPLPRGGNLSLGELLKYKSEEGVRVLLLVWDDKTSHKYFIKKEGVMQTHDEETRKFFKHSSVTCVLAPRYASSKLSLIKQQVVGTLFTHHQKCVLVDTQAHGSYRKITAFLGGLDLCDGRYDTPEHRIFRDLNTVFQDDFHNPTFPSGTRAPRQPWHDLHCKVDGPAAYDVLINFEQRWRRATRFREFSLKKRITTWHDDALIKINRISWILCPVGGGTDTEVTVIPAEDHSVWVSKETDPDTWHVQVFRSIDSGSLNGFSKAASDVYTKNLICSKDLVIDKSIQTAYIQAIRSAQHFIYIENQYFLGSSYGWPSYKNAGADNLIPMELALKIASKIKAKERFAVYVVIPLWPEGDPRSASVQEILYWQSQTMEMMYGIVARELKNMQLEDSSPEDYLNFYCLGNREEIAETSAAEVSSSDDGAKVSDAMRNRRFMIYVHAKGMIVDDEYVILGSANINQRSLAGSKDTEIAIGAYQPHQTWGQKKKHPRGQVYGYRMSLWAEHLGTVDPDFNEPETLECVHKVNAVANDNWKRFTGESFATLQGHLLKYPLQVSVDGKVESLPDEETFPDVGGKIIGSPSPALPDILTT